MATRSPGPRGLVVVSLVAVVGVVAWYGRAEQAMVRAPAVVTGCAAVSVGWSLLTGLGIGGAFLLPWLLLLVAAMISWVDRGRDRAGPLRT